MFTGIHIIASYNLRNALMFYDKLPDLLTHEPQQPELIVKYMMRAIQYLPELVYIP